MAKAQVVQWYNQRKYAAILGLVLLLATYLMGSRSLDTGSLIEYTVTFVLLGFSINRFIKAIKG